ncbi:hypothetical protein PIROE2DRAFT_11389 [Piromyces sp. E2]|nr:hypothetical protein PIROE2DRAFT_11389 [Piromyces sp. E2]|eukprot:OUM62338.1 hypothetical protein PIROE2DRAFT_11389 [Piromyces sp. E2]
MRFIKLLLILLLEVCFVFSANCPKENETTCKNYCSNKDVITNTSNYQYLELYNYLSVSSDYCRCQCEVNSIINDYLHGKYFYI